MFRVILKQNEYEKYAIKIVYSHLLDKFDKQKHSIVTYCSAVWRGDDMHFPNRFV